MQYCGYIWIWKLIYNLTMTWEKSISIWLWINPPQPRISFEALHNSKKKTNIKMKLENNFIINLFHKKEEKANNVSELVFKWLGLIPIQLVDIGTNIYYCHVTWRDVTWREMWRNDRQDKTRQDTTHTSKQALKKYKKYLSIKSK